MKISFNPITAQFDYLPSLAAEISVKAAKGLKAGNVQAALEELAGRRSAIFAAGGGSSGSGTMDHAALQHLDHATAGHVGFQSALTFPLSPDLGGTGVDNGVNELTVPASGTAALLAVANVFTTQQMVDGTSDQIQLRVQAHSTQTANALTVESSAGVVGGGFGPDGKVFSDGGVSGSANVIFGGSGNLTMTGNQNFLLGQGSGIALTSGTNNVAIGHGTMRLNQTGVDNIIIGAASGGYTGSGAGVDPDFNVVIGSGSGYALTGDRNVFLGYRAGRFETGSDKLFIDSTSRADEATARQNAFIYGEMAAGGRLQVNIGTTTNNASKEIQRLQAYVTTASAGGAAGFGAGQSFYAETATDGTQQQQAEISAAWVDATNATRKAKLSLAAYDTARRLGLEIEADGAAPKVGFFGAAPAGKPAAYTPSNVTADRSYDANATTLDELADVLGTLISDLQSLGLIG